MDEPLGWFDYRPRKRTDWDYYNHFIISHLEDADKFGVCDICNEDTDTYCGYVQSLFAKRDDSSDQIPDGWFNR